MTNLLLSQICRVRADRLRGQCGARIQSRQSLFVQRTCHHYNQADWLSCLLDCLLVLIQVSPSSCSRRERRFDGLCGENDHHNRSISFKAWLRKDLIAFGNTFVATLMGITVPGFANWNYPSFSRENEALFPVTAFYSTASSPEIHDTGCCYSISALSLFD